MKDFNHFSLVFSVFICIPHVIEHCSLLLCIFLASPVLVSGAYLKLQLESL